MNFNSSTTQSQTGAFEQLFTSLSEPTPFFTRLFCLFGFLFVSIFGLFDPFACSMSPLVRVFYYIAITCVACITVRFFLLPRHLQANINPFDFNSLTGRSVLFTFGASGWLFFLDILWSPLILGLFSYPPTRRILLSSVWSPRFVYVTGVLLKLSTITVLSTVWMDGDVPTYYHSQSRWEWLRFLLLTPFTILGLSYLPRRIVASGCVRDFGRALCPQYRFQNVRNYSQHLRETTMQGLISSRKRTVSLLDKVRSYVPYILLVFFFLMFVFLVYYFRSSFWLYVLFLIPCLPFLLHGSMWYSIFQLHNLDFAMRLRHTRIFFQRRYRTQSSKASILPRKARKSFRRAVLQTQGFQIANAAGLVGMEEKTFRSTVSIVESVFILSYQLADAKTTKMRAIAVAAFVKSINGGSAISLDIMSKIDEVFSDSFETQGFIDYVNSGKDTHDRFKNLRDSPGMTKIYTFIMYVLSLGLFSKAGLTLSKAGFSRIEEANLKRKHSSKMGFVDSLLDMALFVCTAGYQAFAGMSVEHIVHSPAAYGEFYDSVEVFSQDFERYKESNVGAGVDHTKLLSRLSDLIQKYLEIEKILPQLDKTDRSVLLKMRGKLLSYEARLKNEKICQSNRPAPYSLLIAGNSSIGKSVLTECFYNQFARLRKLPHSAEYKYVRSPTQEFWDNFDSKMWCLVLDDIAWAHPATGTIDQSVSEILHIINNVSYTTNQASLEKKGTTPFLGHFVIGTTNTRDLNAAHYFKFPAAARRRFPFILDITTKKEYDDGEGNLVVNENLPYPNYWNISIKELCASGRDIKEKTLLKTDSMAEALAWFNGSVRTFYERQGRAQSSVDVIHAMEHCELCELPARLCSCEKDDLKAVCEANLYESTLSFDNVADFLNHDLVSQVIEKESDTDEVETQGAIEFIAVFSLGLWLGSLATSFLSNFANVFIWRLAMKRLACKWGDTKHRAATCFYHNTGRTRTAFTMLGAKVQTRVVRIPKFFLVLGALIVAGSALKYFMGRSEAQGNIVPLTKEREDYFYSPTMEITKFDGNLKSRCMDMSSLQNRVANNVAYCVFQSERKRSKCRMVGLGGEYYLANSHTIPDDLVSANIQLGVKRNGITMETTVRLDANDVVRDVENDLAIVRVVSLPPRRSIREFFLPTQPTGNASGLYVDRGSNGVVSTIEMPHITYGSQKPKDLNTSLYCAMSQSAVRTVDGQCGMPLLANCGQNKAILGIHSLASVCTIRPYIGATVVTQTHIANLLSQFDDSAMDREAPVLASQGGVRDLVDLHPKSVFRYMSGSATMHGSFVGKRADPKSRVTSTPIRDHLAEYGISTTFCKPVMTGWRPWRIAALDMVNPVTEITTAEARLCGKSYLAHVRNVLPKGAIKKVLQRYDEFTSINGAEGIAFVDGVKRGTSAGAPFAESKKKHLTKETPQRGLMDPVKLLPEMSARVAHVRELYDQGIAYNPVFTAHLKDEAVSAKKAQTGKTRIFCGAPFDWSVVVRELFLSHVRLMQNFKFEFECGVGTVAPSTEWSAMYYHITKFGSDRIIAGDYKAYDKRMPPVLILEAFHILIELAIESGNFSDEDIKGMRCVAQDTAYPLVDFNGDLVTFWGSNPSGHPLTVIINSIANSLYMRLAFHKTGHDVMTFSENVSLMTYGDDNIMSVAQHCSGFNHTTVQSALNSIGVVYTMADKEAASVPFIDISEASFLKRSWRWNDDHSVYTAPLDEESIFKMLCVYGRSKSITVGEQLKDIIHSAHREWWHYGQIVFEERCSMLRDVISRAELESYFVDSPLLSYDTLWENFHDVSLKTKSTL